MNTPRAAIAVPMTTLCQWFGLVRRTAYYKPTRSPAKVKPELAGPIKEMIEAKPSFSYRTIAALSGMNKNTVLNRPGIPGRFSAADLSAERLASSQACPWPTPTHRGQGLPC